MSALGHSRPSHFVPVLNNVRYASDSDHSRYESELTLWANNGLIHRSKMSRYPITSSARMRIVGGTVTPIALAVFEDDKKLKFRGLLNRKIGGVRPFEDLVDERACASVQGRHVQSIGCKHAGFPLLAGKRNGRQSLPGRA